MTALRWPIGVVLAAVLAVSLVPRAVAGPLNAPATPYHTPGKADSLRTQALPDIEGPGKISVGGNVWLKTTNMGVMGNPFTQLSNDPSAQWPGSSGVEYLFFVGLWVGAKDPGSLDLDRIRRVSQDTEWRPPTLEPQDRIYESREGQEGGVRLFDDDGDGRMDEDRLDGRDNDGDGLIDEDHAAISQQMFACTMRDDTREAIEFVSTEPHIPLGLEVHQKTYSFSLPGAQDYTAVEYVIENVGTVTLDSVFVAFYVDQDVGPPDEGRYFYDDLPEPRVPQGPDPSIPLPDTVTAGPDNPNTPYVEFVEISDPRYQPDVPPYYLGPGPCWRDVTRVNGFTMVDNDGDDGRTPGASSFLLLGHTTDALGRGAPDRVGFRMYDHFTPGRPFSQGGPPANDQERYQLISSTRNIDRATGFITAAPPTEPGDYFSICSVGPYLSLAPGDRITVTWALAVEQVDYQTDRNELARRYDSVIRNAVAAQRNYDGVYEVREGFVVPDSAQWGRETLVAVPPGGIPLILGDCHDFEPRFVAAGQAKWFDLDCNTCTGVPGHHLRNWALISGPPPDPQLELVPRDRSVLLRWDNQSEYTPDPETHEFDIKGYALWRASDWTRPVGSIGPEESLWRRLAIYHLHDEANPLIEIGTDPSTGEPDTTVYTSVLLNRAWRPGSRYPRLIHARDVPCIAGDDSECDTVYATKPIRPGVEIEDYPVVRYPVGRYELEDKGLLNGFTYFYAVTAFDSSGAGLVASSFGGRRSARALDGVVPQVGAAGSGGAVYAVPNPYRGTAEWDLTPNAVDPTGTHIDFFNMPSTWSVLRIYTVSGDLVQELRPTDFQANGKPQREGPEDGQASWNLVSRNGQEVVSGIYLFTVQSDQGSQQGKFVIIQ
jgi:hypothetical protein